MDGKTTLYMLDETPVTGQMMSFVIKTSTNKLIVIDGGYSENAPVLYDFLCKLSDKSTPTVSAWILTHAHRDHVDAICRILNNKSDFPMEIERICFNFIDFDFALENEPKEAHTVMDFMNATKNIEPHKLIKVQRNDVITIDEVTFRIMSVPENKYKNNAINNSSLLIKMNANGKSVLFTGDLGVEAGEENATLYGNELKCDYIQMAHHGQNGVNKAFYELASPNSCLWCTPLWLWNNDAGGGINTYMWKTMEVRNWMNELDVKEHFKTFEGIFEILI